MSKLFDKQVFADHGISSLKDFDEFSKKLSPRDFVENDDYFIMLFALTISAFEKNAFLGFALAFTLISAVMDRMDLFTDPVKIAEYVATHIKDPDERGAILQILIERGVKNEKA